MKEQRCHFYIEALNKDNTYDPNKFLNINIEEKDLSNCFRIIQLSCSAIMRMMISLKTVVLSFRPDISSELYSVFLQSWESQQYWL